MLFGANNISLANSSLPRMVKSPRIHMIKGEQRIKLCKMHYIYGPKDKAQKSVMFIMENRNQSYLYKIRICIISPSKILVLEEHYK